MDNDLCGNCSICWAWSFREAKAVRSYSSYVHHHVGGNQYAMLLSVVCSSGFCKDGWFQPQSKYRVNKVFQRTTLPESSIQPLLLAKQPIEYEATEPFFGSKSWYAIKGHIRILKYFLSCMSVHFTSCLVLPLFVKSSLSGRPPSTSAFSWPPSPRRMYVLIDCLLLRKISGVEEQ